MRTRVVFWIVLTLWSAGALTLNSPVWAAEKAKDKPAAEAADPQREQFLTQVRQNIGALNLQEVTVQILAAQYQKELNNLQQMQAVFCDTYKLDVTKFRQRGYRFDEKQAKFVEQEVAARP